MSFNGQDRNMRAISKIRCTGVARDCWPVMRCDVKGSINQERVVNCGDRAKMGLEGDIQRDE